jgi:hypothetical protein
MHKGAARVISRPHEEVWSIDEKSLVLNPGQLTRDQEQVVKPCLISPSNYITMAL